MLFESATCYAASHGKVIDAAYSGRIGLQQGHRLLHIPRKYGHWGLPAVCHAYH
jgi:hypothetical protein